MSVKGRTRRRRRVQHRQRPAADYGAVTEGSPHLSTHSYLVELMEGEAVEALGTVSAASPFVAATIGANREVSFKVDKSGPWVRVTPLGRKPFEFGYPKY